MCEQHRTAPLAAWHSCSVLASRLGVLCSDQVKGADCLRFWHRRQRGILGGRRLAGAPGVL